MYITTSRDLNTLVSAIRQSGRVGVDTEFVTERTYYPALGLVQLSYLPAGDTAATCAAVDPLQIDDLSPLDEIMLDAAVVKIFHAAKSDLEIFCDRLGRVPAPIFDVQIAAALLGYGDQLSLTALAKRIINVELKHDEAFTDWTARPLTQNQIEYALDDVRYLLHLHDMLTAELAAHQRTQWVAEECAKLTRTELYDRGAPEEQYHRVKGWSALPSAKLAVLRELAAWREAEAQRRNFPRRRILRDEVMLDLARRRPTNIRNLQGTRGAHPREIERYAEQIFAAVERGAAVPKEKLPAAAHRHPVNRQGAAIVDILNTVVKVRAKEHKLGAQFLATRSDLEDLVAAYGNGDNSSHAVLQGWRREIVGEDLIAFLNGTAALSIAPQSGEVVIRRT